MESLERSRSTHIMVYIMIVFPLAFPDMYHTVSQSLQEIFVEKYKKR